MQSKIKIAFVIGKYDLAGTRVYVQNFLKHLDHDKFMVDFVVYSEPDDGDSSLVEDSGGHVFISGSPKSPHKYLTELQRIFENGKYDIVHSFINTLNIFPMRAAKNAGVPIRISHNLSTGSRGEKKTVIKKVLRPFNLYNITNMAANSYYCGEWLFGKENHNKIKVFHNGIDLDRYFYNRPLRNTIRHELGITDKFAVGHIGRYEYQKNHDFLIDIFAEIKKINPQSVLLLIGFGDLKEQIFKKINDLNLTDSVIDLGKRADIEKFYNAMDCFLLPSNYEGLPIVAIEAQATGLPVLMSDRVTREAAITSQADFLPLTVSAHDWAEKAIEMSKSDRYSPYDEIRSNGYDIRIETKKLENYYEKLYSYINRQNGEINE